MAGLLLSFSLCPLPVLADVLEIPGTGACEVLLRAVADAFNREHTEHRVIVPPSIGTVGGMRLITGDQAVLVRVAQPLKEKEKGQGLMYLPFARDLVVFAVGAKVPVRSITTAQLAEVYAGKIATWQELGGPPVPIRVLLRQPGDSSLLAIQKHLEPFRQITFAPAGKVLSTDPDMLAMLQKYNFSIGFLTFSSLKGAKTPIHPLALDGIAPTPETAPSRQYKIIEEYALVFKEKRLNDLARSFLDFIFSKNGQQVMKQYGVTPVEKE
ncbi:MAG: hypothetical protein A2Y80_00515 [Deltaproteobacteria bacterium RBG_13_58_19]|nr:MAG: hypothetical protein A2Y80_00515 [Deltaproteobacteria bacterium RBG_13_58_19]